MLRKCILFALLLSWAGPAAAAETDNYILELGAGGNIGVVKQNVRLNKLYGENVSFRFLAGKSKHFIGAGLEFGTLRHNLEDPAPDPPISAKMVTFCTVAYRYQRELIFIDVMWFVLLSEPDNLGAGALTRVGVRWHFGPVYAGAGLGGGWGTEAGFLNLQLFTGMTF